MKPLTENAKKLIDGSNFASIATLMPDGSPQVAPIWVDREGDVVLINTTESRQRTRNLRKDPRVAISIFDMKNPYSKILIRGRVVEITKKGAEDHIDKMAMKYRGLAKYPAHNPDDPRVILRIEAAHITD
ncbi:MAG TPA: PPOX class F420-dependent oxidoreductase [Nitrososphaerales archaeon]|nr:PPOX class F420-dependent oxidoreductase [Nitrososphaerales archaeon]